MGEWANYYNGDIAWVDLLKVRGGCRMYPDTDERSLNQPVVMEIISG